MWGFQCQFWASELGSSWSQPTLNQTGELKAHFCWSEDVDELVMESVGVGGGAKYPPALPQRVMVSATREMRARTPDSRSGLVGNAELAVEIFAGDDVGRGHGPVFGGLDVALFEDDFAGHVGDGGGAAFPLDLVVGRDAGLGKAAGKAEAGR